MSASWPASAQIRAVLKPKSETSPSEKDQRVRRLRWNRYSAELALVVAAYFLWGRIGLAVPFTSGNVSPVWPPAGIALAAALIFGYRVWPAIALGAFLVNFFSPIPHWAALGLALGDTVGPLAGAAVLRMPGFSAPVKRLRDVLALIMGAAPGGAAISAIMGSTVLFATGVKPWTHFGPAWLVWWLGDSLGMLIFTPLILSFLQRRVLPERRAELGVLLASSAAACLLIFNRRFPFGSGNDVLGFLLLPFVIWGAIRFATAGASFVTFVVAALAVWETGHGRGPFVGNTPLQNAVLLQLFLAAISITGFSLAAVISERAELVRRQAAREATQQSEKRYRNIVETANEGIWMLDARLATSFVNVRMAEMMGYSVEEMLGRSVFDFFFAEDVEKKWVDFDRRRRGVRERLESRFRKQDGAELLASVATTPLHDERGAFNGVLAMISDITDQKRAERERARALETVLLLSRAMEQTADSVIITDRQGVIGYVNPALEATTGYRREEFLGRTPNLLKSGLHDAAFWKEVWELLLRGEPWRGAVVNRKKSGELYWGEQTITPIKDEQGNVTHFVSVLKDVTELRKKQEQEVQLRLAREVQQQFYTAAAHVPGFDIAAAAYPAEETGGDYFDFIEMPDKSLYLAIGDVSGHGFGSALVMALTRAYVRSFAGLKLDVGEILFRVNRMLVQDLEEGRFATVFLLRLDPVQKRLAYASAGHVPGFVLGASGEVGSVLRSTGLPLGLFPECVFPAAELQLEPQQTLVLLTDGAVEMSNGDDVQFGEDGVLDCVRAHRSEPAREIVRCIYDAARRHAGSERQHDDVTAVVLKVA